jgi:sugar lactone lactonase YvrE
VRRLLLLAGVALAVLVVGGATQGTPAATAEVFPEIIELPNGWLPEGVAIGKGPVIYSGSRANGAIYAADLRTGEGEVIVEGVEGRVAVGLSFDPRSNLLFVAGGPSGDGYVFDVTSGELVATYDFTSMETFVNDVVVTRDAAYFTDSMRAQLYVVALGSGGDLVSMTDFDVLTLSGDYTHVAGQFNLNGIDATPSGDTLIVVHSTLGLLYTVDPATGVATEIDLDGDTLPNGDGILLDGDTLYVVQNRLNQIAVIDLMPDMLAGRVVGTITDDDFDVPTTIAEFGNALYAVNARFTTPPTPDTEYDIVRVEK